MKTLNRFKKSCEKFSGKILVACSGGSDSLALADLFCESGFEIGIAHFDHQIRGEESRADAEFVEKFAADRNLKFFLGSADIINEAKKNQRSHRSIETTAREFRYRFLFETREKFGFDLIATAHHLDDQAETILMNLIRGTGIEGLIGIRERDGFLIRPLLGFTKLELENYCRNRNLQPRHDSTNDLPTTTRNRIRHEILPMLKEFNPNIVATLNRLSQIASSDRDFLKIQAERFFTLKRKIFLNQHVSIQREILRIWFERLDLKNISFDQIESVRELIQKNRGHSSIDLPGGRIFVENGELKFMRRG